MAGQLKIGGNVIATHAGTEGAGTVTLDSSTLTIGSNTTISGSTMDSSTTFPAGTVLQSTSIYRTSHIASGTIGGTSTKYLVNGAKTVMSSTVRHGTGTDIISTSNDYIHTLTARQSNSIYRMHLTYPVYVNTSTHGYSIYVYAKMQYSTSATSGYTTVAESSDDAEDGLFYWYQDNRSTYGTSGQDLHRITGFEDFFSSYSAGTTIYFNVKVVHSRTATEKYATCYVEEIAT